MKVRVEINTYADGSKTFFVETLGIARRGVREAGRWTRYRQFPSLEEAEKAAKDLFRFYSEKKDKNKIVNTEFVEVKDD